MSWRAFQKQVLITGISLVTLSDANAQIGPNSGGGGPTGGNIVTACGSANNQILYDNAGTCTGLTTATNSVLTTSATGTPIVTSTLPSGLTLPSPTMTSPTLGAATATTINGITITAVSSGTLSIATGKTIVLSNSLSLAGTDSTTMTFPGTSATVARIDAAQTIAGIQSFSGQIVSIAGTPTISSGNCGATTNGTIVAGSTNQSGQFSIGASTATSCIISFSATITAPHACVVTPRNAAAATVTTLMFVTAPTTTQFSITGSVLASTNWSYICL